MPGTEKSILPLQRPRATPGRRRETPERGGGRFVAQTEDSNCREGCCGGKGLRRCLVLLGLIYFQVSTFALVQWLKEHADVHGGLPLPRMRRALEPADGSTALALPPRSATLPPSPPPPPATVSGLVVPSRASEAPSLPSRSLSHSPPPPLPPPRAGEQDEDAVDELPNELPSLDKDLDKEGEAGVDELGEHGGETGVSEELVGLALPEGEAGVGALGGEPGAGRMVAVGQSWPPTGRAGRPRLGAPSCLRTAALRARAQSFGRFGPGLLSAALESRRGPSTRPAPPPLGDCPGAHSQVKGWPYVLRLCLL